MKAPIGLERLQSDADLPLLERGARSEPDQLSATSASSCGATSRAASSITSIGIFNGAPDTNQPTTPTSTTRRTSMGRLFFHPFKAESLHGLRQSRLRDLGADRQPQGRRLTRPPTVGAAQTGLSPYRTAGQNTFFQYLAPATDTTGALTTFAHERATRINPQLYYYYGSFGLLAEYLWLKQGAPEGEHQHRGADAAGGRTRPSATRIGGTRGLRRHHARAVGFDPEQGHVGRAAARGPLELARDRRRDVPDLRESGRERALGAGVRRRRHLGSAAQRSLRRQLRADAVQGRGRDGGVGHDPA